jgi:uncharacterized protein YwgA
MHRYHLAKLIDLAGGLDSRKRVQKVVYLLQAAGCDLGADYHLHHYGPYSTDVARTLDDLVRSDVLEETRSSLSNGGRRFSYKTAASGGEQIADLEKTRRGELLQQHLKPFEAFAAELAGANPWHLEIASTIAFYVCDGREDWEVAKRKAFDFKKVEPGTSAATAAEALARRALQFQATAAADAA